MGKLVLAHIGKSDNELELKVEDIQRIQRVPKVVQDVIKENFKGRRLLKSGLPSVTYLGPERVVVTGAFNYGELLFMEIDGKWSNIVKTDSLVCIVPYRQDATYEELEESKEDEVKRIKEKYPKGMEVQ